MALPGDAIIEVAFRSSLFGQQVMNVLHYRVAVAAPVGVSVIAEMTQLAAILNDDTIGGVKNRYLLCVPAQLSLNQISVQPVYPLRYRKVVAIAGTNGLGGDTTVPNIQASLTLTTDFAGRDQIGGLRLPLATTESATGQVDPDHLDLIGALGQELLAPIPNPGLESSYQLVIWHRGIQPPNSYTGVTGYIPQSTTRVMRRRTVGLGI